MKKLLNFRPLLFISLSLCSGIATAYFILRGFIVWAVLFISVFVCLTGLFLFLFTNKSSRKKNGMFIAVLIAFFLFGAFALNVQITRFSSPELSGGFYTVTGRVGNCYKTSSGNKLTLDGVHVKGGINGKLSYKLSLTVYGESDIDIGDVIVFSSHVYENSYIYEGNFNAYSVEKNIKYSATVSLGDITLVGNFKTVFDQVNVFIRNSLKAGLDEDEFSVGYALLTGDDSYMDYDIISAYRTAGVAHIFAVSGLHIGFLATVLGFIFTKLKTNGYLKAVLITIILFLYSGVCGFSASSLRATIMCAVLLFSSAKGLRYDSLSSISLAGTIILICSPINLMCVGFQLSFGVVLGICLLAKPIANKLKFLPEKLASTIAVVVSAQVVAIPISLANFGCFSWISVCVNLIFVPVVSIVYVLTFLTCIIGGIFSISSITLFLSNYIFKFINLCIPFFDNGFFMVGDVIIGGGIIAYYLALIIPCGLFNVGKIVRRITTIALCAVLIATTCFYTVTNQNATKVYVSSNNGVSATLISYPTENTLVVSNAEHIYSATRLIRLANSSGERVVDNLIFMGGYPIDIQVFMTKLRTAFSVKNVYYYGQQNANMEVLVKQSFNVNKIENVQEKENLPINSFNASFELEGRLLLCNANQKKLAIFSILNDVDANFNKVDLSGTYLMVCYDRASALLSKYSPNVALSYLYSTTYTSAMSNGNIAITL